MDSADSEEAQAASVVQLVPPRLKRLAMRPVITLPSRPGKVASVQGTYWSEMRWHTAWASGSGTPWSRKALSHTGRCSRLAISPSSSMPAAAPRITLTREVSILANCPRVASSSTRRATISASSWQVSMEESVLGGTPNSIGSKSTLSRKAPRRP